LSEDEETEAVVEGTRVSFPYGGTRRIGTVVELIAQFPDGKGGTHAAYLIDIERGQRKVFVQGAGVVPAGSGAAVAFDAVAEGVAYGRKRPRNARR
jgi:hypothetical protein